jgi:hypothetical protein
MTRIPALTTAASILAIAFAVWSLAAPWAAAFPGRADHYKVTLFGVRHVSDMSAQSAQTSCGWGGDEPSCRPSPGGQASYAALTSARWLMLVSLGMLLTATAELLRGRRPPGGALVWVSAILATGIAVMLFRANVVQALAVFAGARAVVAGSGMVGAIGSAAFAAIAAGRSTLQQA